MKKFLAMLLLMSANSYAKEGRYQLLRINDYPNTLTMIDTQTGKIWRRACYTQREDNVCPVEAWSPENVVGVNTTEEKMWKMAEAYEKSKAKKVATEGE